MQINFSLWVILWYVLNALCTLSLSEISTVVFGPNQGAPMARTISFMTNGYKYHHSPYISPKSGYSNPFQAQVSPMEQRGACGLVQVRG